MELSAALNIENRRKMARYMAECRGPAPAVATGPVSGKSEGARYEDALYQLDYLIQAARIDSKTLFNQFVLWARTLYRERGIPEEELLDMLRYLEETVNRHLPDREARMLASYIDSGLQALNTRSDENETYLKSSAPLAEEARAYLELLLDRRREEAAARIERLLRENTPLREIYEHIFQNCLWEIGRLWESNQITVADEHYFTAATQLIISRSYSSLFNTEKKSRRLVACSAAGELHEIGARMVADFFEMEGWDTHYLGGNVPGEDLISSLKEHECDLLAISVTMLPFLARAEELIQRIRSNSGLSGIRIMVGGYPFREEPELWKRLGADGTAQTAADAIETATELFK